jgi:hypothetical protein
MACTTRNNNQPPQELSIHKCFGTSDQAEAGDAIDEGHNACTRPTVTTTPEGEEKENSKVSIALSLKRRNF